MEAIYVPRHDTQFEPRTVCSGKDCNMSASADALRWWSLGLIDRNHHDLRALQPGGTAECTDATTANDGTTIADALHVLVAHFGVTAIAYDAGDGQVWGDVTRALDRGEIVIAHGDYGSVPVMLRGPIDRLFTGLHSVVFQRRLVKSGVPVVRVGDGLSDGWIYWPETVAARYMRDWPDIGFTFLRVVSRKLKAKGSFANVRDRATRVSTVVLMRITSASRLHVGGTVLGENIGGNRTWYRVYAGTKGIGYVHSSVGMIV
jgi:hypothetical protein